MERFWLQIVLRASFKVTRSNQGRNAAQDLALNRSVDKADTSWVTSSATALSRTTARCGEDRPMVKRKASSKLRAVPCGNDFSGIESIAVRAPECIYTQNKNTTGDCFVAKSANWLNVPPSPWGWGFPRLTQLSCRTRSMQLNVNIQ
jgi:hypothetical protein